MGNENNLYKKIARIMGKLNRLPKTGYNDHFKYPFVTDADVADAVRKELADENVAFFASMIGAEQEGKHTVATFEFTFACGDSGDTQVCQWVGEANDGQDKGLTKAATSAEKYFLLKTFVLSAGDVQDDPDSGNVDRGGQPPLSEPDAVTWTRNEDAKGTLTRLRNKAAEHWGNDDGPMNYSHVYNRLAIIIGSEQRPTAFPAFCDMMRDECKLSGEDVWAGVEAYKGESES